MRNPVLHSRITKDEVFSFLTSTIYFPHTIFTLTESNYHSQARGMQERDLLYFNTGSKPYRRTQYTFLITTVVIGECVER